MNIVDWKLINPCKDCDRTEVFRHFYTLEGDCRCDDFFTFDAGRKSQIQLLEYLLKYSRHGKFMGCEVVMKPKLEEMLKDLQGKEVEI